MLFKITKDLTVTIKIRTEEYECPEYNYSSIDRSLPYCNRKCLIPAFPNLPYHIQYEIGTTPTYKFKEQGISHLEFEVWLEGILLEDKHVIDVGGNFKVSNGTLPHYAVRNAGLEFFGILAKPGDSLFREGIRPEEWDIEVRIFGYRTSNSGKHLELPRGNKGPMVSPREILAHYRFVYYCREIIPGCLSREELGDTILNPDFLGEPPMYHYGSRIKYQHEDDLLCHERIPGHRERLRKKYIQRKIDSKPSQLTLMQRSGEELDCADPVLRPAPHVAAKRKKVGIPKRVDSDRFSGELRVSVPLPAGWEVRSTEDRNIYYVNHTRRATQWRHPRLEVLSRNGKPPTYLVEVSPPGQKPKSHIPQITSSSEGKPMAQVRPGSGFTSAMQNHLSALADLNADYQRYLVGLGELRNELRKLNWKTSPVVQRLNVQIQNRHLLFDATKSNILELEETIRGAIREQKYKEGLIGAAKIALAAEKRGRDRNTTARKERRRKKHDAGNRNSRSLKRKLDDTGSDADQRKIKRQDPENTSREYAPSPLGDYTRYGFIPWLSLRSNKLLAEVNTSAAKELKKRVVKKAKAAL